MAEQRGFTIEISSRYAGWWRYNVALMCGCFDAAGERTDFASAESHVAEVGANLPSKPADIVDNRSVQLVTPPCDHLVAYLYIIPHTLPAKNNIEGEKPFDIDLRISYDGRTLRSETRPINQWSGTSAEIRIGHE